MSRVSLVRLEGSKEHEQPYGTAALESRWIDETERAVRRLGVAIEALRRRQGPEDGVHRREAADLRVVLTGPQVRQAALCVVPLAGEPVPFRRRQGAGRPPRPAEGLVGRREGDGLGGVRDAPRLSEGVRVDVVRRPADDDPGDAQTVRVHVPRLRGAGLLPDRVEPEAVDEERR